MAEIVESIVGDRALRLYNEQFGRRLAFGAAWGKIRVAIRYVINASSTLNDTALVIGVSQGTTNMYRSAQCLDFIGTHHGATLNLTDYTYNAGPPAFSSSGGFTPLVVGKIGASVTTVLPGGSTTSYLAIAPTRGVFAVDIEKSFNQVRITPRSVQTQVVAQSDLNYGNFTLVAENDLTMLSITGSSPNPVLFPYTGQFAWDSVNIDYNNAVQPIEISDLLVIRYY